LEQKIDLLFTNSVTFQFYFTKGEDDHIALVKEYSTFAKNFALERKAPVVALDVSPCVPLAIYDIDENNNKTAFSLTHFRKEKLSFSLPMSKSVEPAIENFKKHG